MFFANFLDFRELKTELQPQRPGGVRPDPSSGWGPARTRANFFLRYHPLWTGGSGKTPERFLARNYITKFFVEKFDSHVNSLFLPTHWMAKKKFRLKRKIPEI